jgi:hypothetical protein
MLEDEALRLAYGTAVTLEQLDASKRQMLGKIWAARDNHAPAPFLAHRSLRLFEKASKIRIDSTKLPTKSPEL